MLFSTHQAVREFCSIKRRQFLCIFRFSFAQLLYAPVKRMPAQVLLCGIPAIRCQLALKGGFQHGLPVAFKLKLDFLSWFQFRHLVGKKLLILDTMRCCSGRGGRGKNIPFTFGNGRDGRVVACVKSLKSTVFNQ